MAEIKELNKCNDCIHQKVCEFKLDREETVSQMNGKLDNIGYMRDIFNFSFNCNEHKTSLGNTRRGVQYNEF